MPAKLAPGDTCPKDGKGLMTNLQYVRQGDTRTNTQCYGCPFTEHLHLSCTVCGYTISMATADSPAVVVAGISGEPTAPQMVPPPTIPVPTRPDAAT